MSEENVERFKESLERFNRDGVAGALRYFHPDIRFEHRLAELQGQVTGIDAVREWFVDATTHFDRWTVNCDDVRDLGDRVLALGTVRALGRESGVEVEMPFTVLARFKGGLVTDYTDYGDREKALEAAGLLE